MVKKYVKKTYRRANRPSFTNTMGKVANIAYKGFQIATKIAGLINSEKKFHDDVFVPTVLLEATPQVRHLTDIDGGSDDGQRVGNKIALKSMYTKYIVHWDPTNSDGIIRHIVVRSKSALAGSALTTTAVLQTVATPVDRIYSPLIKTRAGTQFQVLADEILLQDESRENILKENYHIFKMKKDMQGNRTVSPHTTYTGVSGGNYQEGTLWEMWFFYGTSSPTIGGYNRIRYMDN